MGESKRRKDKDPYYGKPWAKNFTGLPKEDIEFVVKYIEEVYAGNIPDWEAVSLGKILRENPPISASEIQTHLKDFSPDLVQEHFSWLEEIESPYFRRPDRLVEVLKLKAVPRSLSEFIDEYGDDFQIKIVDHLIIHEGGIGKQNKYYEGRGLEIGLHGDHPDLYAFPEGTDLLPTSVFDTIVASWDWD